MAMINDKGPEESRDTDGTYIILSHQSVHLPGPSRQRMGRVGEVEEERERKRDQKKKKREEKGESYLLLVLYTQELLFSYMRKMKKVTKR